MLEMGVLPQVASATSACMILYTSFTATTRYCYGYYYFQLPLPPVLLLLVTYNASLSR
jgi:uncharacterized membrane protein YfcA